MTIVERLDRLRGEFPACTLVAFGDLTTGTVLCSSSASPVPQERLDSLCATAADLLDGAVARQIGEVLARDGRALHAIAIDADEIGLFLRASDHPADALACLCTSLQEFDRFVAVARASLDSICDAQ